MWYNAIGIFSLTAVRFVILPRIVRPLIFLARKDRNSVLRTDLPCWSRRHSHLPKTESALLHGIAVDGKIERIDGGPEFANAAVEKARKAGHAADYLFAAKSEEEFERKSQGNPAKIEFPGTLESSMKYGLRRRSSTFPDQ